MWTSVVMGGKWVLSPFYIYALYKRRCLSSVTGNTFAKGTLESMISSILLTILLPSCHTFVLFLYLFIFSAGCPSVFFLFFFCCRLTYLWVVALWALAERATALFATVAMVATKLSWLRGKAENLGGSDEKGDNVWFKILLTSLQ